MYACACMCVCDTRNHTHKCTHMHTYTIAHTRKCTGWRCWGHLWQTTCVQRKITHVLSLRCTHVHSNSRTHTHTNTHTHNFILSHVLSLMKDRHRRRHIHTHRHRYRHTHIDTRTYTQHRNHEEKEGETSCSCITMLQPSRATLFLGRIVHVIAAAGRRSNLGRNVIPRANNAFYREKCTSVSAICPDTINSTPLVQKLHPFDTQCFQNNS